MDLLGEKLALLTRLDRVFEAYVNGMYRTACKPGCSSCCTRHVTVTTLEGYQIHDHLAGNDGIDIRRCKSTDASPFRPTYTTNDLASACLNHRELPEESPGPDMSSCPLLDGDRCSLYGIRPFACRAFLSLRHCALDGQAEIPSALASVIGICQQIIEHTDVNGYFGNMSDMLVMLALDGNARAYARNEGVAKTEMPATKPLPGFLIPPEDREEVNAFLSRLFNAKIGDRVFLQILSAIRPLPSNTR